MFRSSLLAGFDRVTPENERLLGAIAQLPQALESNPVYAWYRLPKSVLHKAQGLVHVLTELRSPQSGWPMHLAYTVENLAPYVAEEAYELLEALKQLALSRRGGLAVVPAEPLHLVDWQLRQADLAALRSQLLWEMASSGHGVMQLLQGVSARMDEQLTQLYLVINLETQSGAVDLNGPSEGQTVSDDTVIHFECAALASAPQTTRALLTKINRVLQRNPILHRFLQRQAVQLLEPGQRWQQTFLQIRLRLVADAVPERNAEVLSDAAVVWDDSQFILPVLPALDTLLLSGIEEDDLKNDGAECAVNRAEDLAIRTVEDLAVALTGSAVTDEMETALEPRSGASAIDLPPVEKENVENSAVAARLGNGGGVSGQGEASSNGHRSVPQTMPAAESETLIPAWITVTDDRWISSLLEMTARQQLIADLPLQRLLDRLHHPQARLEDLLSPVIAAACSATTRAGADTGLFHQNFFQQAVYLEDLLPQLLWYVYRASPVIAQLINGIPARFLAPDHLWQTGEIRLLTTLQLRTRQRKMMIDLATGKPLSFPVQRLARDGVVQSVASPLTQQPYTVAQLETRLYRLLRQATPELDWLLRGAPLELHLLEPVNEPERQTGAMQLGLGLQFAAAPTTVEGKVTG